MTEQHPTRRTVLRSGAVIAVAAPFAGLVSRASALVPSSTVARALSVSSACATLTQEATEGPFWVDERLNRSDIRADSETGAVQEGVPLTLTFTLLDSGGRAPQVGAFVDVWHANAQGTYSDVSGPGNPDNIGVDWLRGYQVSDENGQVTFQTVFPGWYVGRTIHVHFRIRVTLSDDSEVNFTSQLFFDESVNDAVVATTAYQKSGTRTTNATDGIYDASLLTPLTGSVAEGFAGAFTVNLDFGDGSDDAGADSTVAAEVVSAQVVRRSGRRQVVVVLDRDEKVAALVRLVRHDDVLASKRTRWLASGRSRVRMAVPRSVRAGKARVVVTVVDEAGNAKIVQRRVWVPKRG